MKNGVASEHGHDPAVIGAVARPIAFFVDLKALEENDRRCFRALLDGPSALLSLFERKPARIAARKRQRVHSQQQDVDAPVLASGRPVYRAG
jgi:hypothetical protein